MSISRGAVVCQEAVIVGQVSIGTGTVIHPTCQILAENGPIVIGTNNIFEEQTVICNKQPETMTIGHFNVLEVGAAVNSANIGDANIVECKARIGAGARIRNGCSIGAYVNIQADTEVADNVVLFADGQQRVQSGGIEAHQSLISRHLEIIRDTLPKYHHLKTTL